MSETNGNGNGLIRIKAIIAVPIFGALCFVLWWIWEGDHAKVEATAQSVSAVRDDVAEVKQDMEKVKQQIEMGREINSSTLRRLERIEDKLDRVLEKQR